MRTILSRRSPCGLRIALAGVLAAGCVLASMAREVAPAGRKSVNVLPPARQTIVVPEAFRGPRMLRGKSGQEYRIDFTEAYRDGYEEGWKLCLKPIQPAARWIPLRAAAMIHLDRDIMVRQRNLLGACLPGIFVKILCVFR
jgi:hypothetical protein